LGWRWSGREQIRMSFKKKIFLERIKSKILQEVPEHIALIITTINLNSANDSDLFIILDNPPTDDPYNIKAYLRLMEAIKAVEKEIEEKNNIRVVDFSTIRIKEYHSNLMYVGEDVKPLELHLLVYPTIDQFLSWENHSIILSVCTHHTLLYGNDTVLRNIKKRVRVNSLEERIQSLVSLLFETYRNIFTYLQLSKKAETVLINEGVRKLEYVLRFLLWELLRESIQSIPPTELRSLLVLAENNNVGRNVIDMLRIVKERKDAKVILSDLRALYEECMFKINSLVHDIRSGENNGYFA